MRSPSGVFTTNLGGGLSKLQAFGLGHTGLIVWTLARDPKDGTLYASTEIFDHPQPFIPHSSARPMAEELGRTWPGPYRGT
jgi:hypothetical protein